MKALSKVWLVPTLLSFFFIGNEAVSHQNYSCNEDLLNGDNEADDERDRSFGHVRVETSNLFVTLLWIYLALWGLSASAFFPCSCTLCNEHILGLGIVCVLDALKPCT